MKLELWVLYQINNSLLSFLVICIIFQIANLNLSYQTHQNNTKLFITNKIFKAPCQVIEDYAYRIIEYNAYRKITLIQDGLYQIQFSSLFFFCILFETNGILYKKKLARLKVQSCLEPEFLLFPNKCLGQFGSGNFNL